MNKISKINYDRLIIQADQLKLMGKTNLANTILNVLGPLSKEAQVEDSSETIVYDIRKKLKDDIFEILVGLFDILGKQINADELDKMSSDYCEKILSDIVK